MKNNFIAAACMLLSFQLYAQDKHALSKSDSALIVSIGLLFETELKPFARKFAEEVYPVKIRTEGLIDSQYRIYMNKAHYLSVDFLDPKLWQNTLASTSFGQERVYTVFESAYRNNFPGLDYSFFEKVQEKFNSGRR